MGKVHDAIDERTQEFLLAQHVFFVATAPREGGHINLSPKGYTSLRVLDAKRVAYVDYPGSGVETIAHLKENGRIVIMVCAFEGPPMIVRVYGKGRVVEPDHAEFSTLLDEFQPLMPVRSIILIEVERVADSCGFSVPLFAYEGDRRQLERWAKKKQREGKLEDYTRRKNLVSIDGLRGLDGLAEDG